MSKLRTPYLRHPAPGYKRLGKGVEQAIANAESHGGSVGVSEVARFLGIKRVRDARRRHLEPLEPPGVADCSGSESLTLREGWADVLERRRLEDGEVEAARLQRERYERQREAFRNAWARGDVLSGDELARQRRRQGVARDEITPEERHVSGAVGELARVDEQDALAPQADLRIVKALKAALPRWPDHRDDYPYWWARTLYLYDYLPTEPTREAVGLALEVLGVEKGKAA